MDRSEQLQYLNRFLLEEMPQYREQAQSFPDDDVSQRRLLRSLMNVRPPRPLSPDFLAVQDTFLAAEREEKGVIDGDTLPAVPSDPRLVLWKGDITRLSVDAIVNAANSQLLGCFVPCHGCIDNAIHSVAGLQLRDACFRLMREQGHPEPAGLAKVTPGYALPARYVLHTVGPIVRGFVSQRDREELAACYRSCLEAAAELRLRSVAFCCISTGEFRFPAREAARIAVGTVTGFLDRTDTSIERVIFDVFQESDYAVYRQLLR